MRASSVRTEAGGSCSSFSSLRKGTAMLSLLKSGGLLLIAALMLFVGQCGTANAQTTFQTPVWGGSIGHPFNDTHAAHEGWYHTGIDYWGPNYQSTYVLAAN